MAERVEIVMPQAGMNMVEATIVGWLKQVGDKVELDEPLVAIETDKVNMEIQSPATGTLVEILVQEDEDAEVGATLGFVETA